MTAPSTEAFAGRLVDKIIVHSSATPARLDKLGAKDIDRWHRQKGWNGIGYHYVIRRDGVIEAGRALSKVGAHTLGKNETSVGICLIGGVADDGQTPEANFTPDQLGSLRSLALALMHCFPMSLPISGHRDHNATACPSFDVGRWFISEEVHP